MEEVYIPELGLSNKGKESMSSQEKKEQEARSVADVDWKYPPLESQLADHTLWLGKHLSYNDNISFHLIFVMLLRGEEVIWT